MCGRTSAREVVRVFPRDERRFRSGQPDRAIRTGLGKIWSLLDRQMPNWRVMVLVALGHSGRRADVGGGDFRTSGRAEETRDASGGAARVSRGARGGALGGCALVRRFGGISRLFEVIGRVAPAPRVARQGVEPPGVAPDRGTASRAKPGMASQLGLESIPVEEEYLHSWKTLGTEWVRRRVRPAVPEALDTGAVEGECHLFVQDKRMADRTEESVYFGVGERPSPAGADAAAREELAERAPQIWRWLARAQTQIASPSVANAWVTTALVKPPPRARSLTFGAKSVAARRKNLLYTVKNKSKQEIDLTHEGEALVDHLALNALLLRHAKEKISNEGMYVTIAGVEPGWEGRELHFAAAARCNALGENLGLDPDGRPPVTMLSAPRMPYTVVRDDYPSHIWHLVFVVPPPPHGRGPHAIDETQRTTGERSGGGDVVLSPDRDAARRGGRGARGDAQPPRGGGGGGGGGDVGGARPGHPPRDRRRGRERDALETAEGRSGGRGRGGGARRARRRRRWIIAAGCKNFGSRIGRTRDSPCTTPRRWWETATRARRGRGSGSRGTVNRTSPRAPSPQPASRARGTSRSTIKIDAEERRTSRETSRRS